MSYAILDNNRFYAEGLRYALQRRGVQLEVHCDIVQWQPLLVTRRVVVVRCRFSVAATHQALISILLKLEAARWKGSLYLVCNEKGWALATHLRKRFAALTIYIIDDRIAVADAAYLLAKEPAAFGAGLLSDGTGIQRARPYANRVAGAPHCPHDAHVGETGLDT